MGGRAAGAKETGGTEQALYGLMAVAEEQQAAVRAALAGLAAQEAALKRELAEWVTTIRHEAVALRGAAGEAGPVLARTARETIGAAMQRELAGAGDTAAAALRTAVGPLLERLSGVAAEAGRAEASLRRVVRWASWQLLGRGAVLAGAVAGLLWLGQWSVWQLTERDLSLARAQRAVVEAEIVGLVTKRDELTASGNELKANRDALVRSGALAKIERCPPVGRLCIRVDEAAGPFGDPPDYRIIRGY